MGDFNSLADVDNDGMGLVNGVVSEESLVSAVLDQGLVDWFRVLYPGMKAVSFGGNQGSYSRIDYMLGGCGLSGVRMCYIPDADGPLSDHALLLGDIGELWSGMVDADERRTSIMDLEGWKPVISTDIPWKRFLKKGADMMKSETGGGFSEAGAEMLTEFRKIVDAEAGVHDIDPRKLLDVLSAASDAAEAGLLEAGEDYEVWAASGGVEKLQSCVDELVPDFLSVVQGSIRKFVGTADHSERESREHTDMMLRTLGQLQGGLKRMNHLRREMVRADVSEPGFVEVVDEKMAGRVKIALRGVEDHFTILEEAMGEGEALPGSLVELLDRGRVEINAYQLDSEDEVPDRVGPEVAEDSLWSVKGRNVFMRSPGRAVVKVRGERFKEFSQGRYDDFSEGRAGVWFQKARRAQHGC